jgi:hypothetical protein
MSFGIFPIYLKKPRSSSDRKWGFIFSRPYAILWIEEYWRVKISGES